MEELIQTSGDTVSLETPVGDEDGSSLGDFVADNAGDSTEDQAENVLLREEIDSMLQGLNERERQVIKLRFGLENGRPLTLEEVEDSSTSPGSASARSRRRRCGNCAIPCGARRSGTFYLKGRDSR